MRRGDANHKLLEAASPFIETGTKLLVHAVLAGKGADALTALRTIMAEAKAVEGEREPVSEDPNVGEGSPSTVRRRQKRSADYQAGRRDYARAMSTTAYEAMSDRLSNAWRDDPPALDSTVTLASVVDSSDAYADYCDRLSNAWQEGA